MNKIVNNLEMAKNDQESRSSTTLDLAKKEEKIRKEINLPAEIFYQSLSTASEVPQREFDYYERAVSIIRKLVQRPSGVKKISTWYRRPIRSSVKRNTRFLNARKSVIRKILNVLKERDLVNWISKSKKGYVTTLKGKNFLEEIR